MALGKLDAKENYNLVNHVLLIGKLYIYSCRCRKKSPLLKVFIARVRLVYFIELHIARGERQARDTLSKMGEVGHFIYRTVHKQINLHYFPLAMSLFVIFLYCSMLYCPFLF